MLIIFFLAVIFCVYTYAGFPIILHLRARASSRQNDSEKVTVQTATDSSGTSSDKPLPTVSVLIAAHNEADRLPNKLTSLRALDYPTERLQICIVSDGSSDNTVKWLQSQADITWDHYEPAAGKPTALNRAVELATGEFLVFTDARQLISANAVQALISRFDDDQIGAVSGELVLSDDGVNEAANIGLYWRYEKWIRMNEAGRYMLFAGLMPVVCQLTHCWMILKHRLDYSSRAGVQCLNPQQKPLMRLNRKQRKNFSESHGPWLEIFNRSRETYGSSLRPKTASGGSFYHTR